MGEEKFREPRRRRPLAAAALLLAAIGLAGGWAWSALLPEPQRELAAITVTRGTVQEAVSALGTLGPRDFVDVGVQVSGQVTALHVELGDRVNEGQLLAEIDPAVLQTRVESDRAQLDYLHAQLAEREAQLALAGQQYRRQSRLLEERATSREAYESAAAAVHVAEAQIVGLQAQITQTISSLRANEVNLGYTRIYAPMAGTIVTLDARPGQTLNANQQTPIILRIADLSVITVKTQVSEADVARLNIGMDAYFTTLGQRSRRWEGKLRQILPTPEVVNDVVLYSALFDVPNDDGELRSQMTAQVFFVQAAAEDVVKIPLAALVTQDGSGEAEVLVITDEGPQPRRIEIGLMDRVSVEVREGLDTGERIALPPATEGPPRGAGTPLRFPGL